MKTANKSNRAAAEAALEKMRASIAPTQKGSCMMSEEGELMFFYPDGSVRNCGDKWMNFFIPNETWSVLLAALKRSNHPRAAELAELIHAARKIAEEEDEEVKSASTIMLTLPDDETERLLAALQCSSHPEAPYLERSTRAIWESDIADRDFLEIFELQMEFYPGTASGSARAFAADLEAND